MNDINTTFKVTSDMVQTCKAELSSQTAASLMLARLVEAVPEDRNNNHSRSQSNTSKPQNSTIAYTENVRTRCANIH